MLTVKEVTVRYGQRTVVDKLSFRLQEGQWLMLAGPNGAGKSTLISAIAQSVQYTGEITLDEANIRRMKPAQLAQKIGVLSQQHHVGYDYTVEEIVSLGRYAHKRGFFSNQDDEEEARVEHALCETGMAQLRHQSILTLSGGEVQRTFLAQVFAQDPQILILDEPANHLDLPYQQHIFGLIGDWLQKPGRAVISVVHDLSLARRFGTQAVLMDAGRCVAQGTSDTVFTPGNLRQVYGMDVYAWMQDMFAQWQQ